MIGINLSGDSGCYHGVAHETWDHAPNRTRDDGTTDAPAYFRCMAIVAVRLRPLKTPSSFPVGPRLAGLLLLRNYSLEYLAGLTADKLEAERGGALPQPTQDACPLLSIVSVGTRIAIDQFSL